MNRAILNTIQANKAMSGQINKQFVNKLLVTGSRSIRDYQLVARVLRNYDCKCLINGGASGVDNIAKRYYSNQNTGLDMVPVSSTDYKKLGKYAYILRDKVMANRADYCVAIWDGHSKGTQHTIGFAKEANIPCDIYTLVNTDKGPILKLEYRKSVQTTLV
jgi:hypothetical protein